MPNKPNDNDIMDSMRNDDGQNFVFGSEEFGRLKFPTEEGARDAADRLDLGGIHRHNMDIDDDGRKEDISMPGNNHDNLNDSLLERGLPPTPVPGQDFKDMASRDMSADTGIPTMDKDVGDMSKNITGTLADEQDEDEQFFGMDEDMALNLGDKDDNDDEMGIY
jgi:hypothetical protein